MGWCVPHTYTIMWWRPEAGTWNWNCRRLWGTWWGLWKNPESEQKLFFQRIWVLDSPPTWHPISIWNASSWGPSTLSRPTWAPDTQVVKLLVPSHPHSEADVPAPQFTLSTLLQSGSALESCLPTGWRLLPHQLRKWRKSPTDVPTGHPDPDSPSLTLSAWFFIKSNR